MGKIGHHAWVIAHGPNCQFGSKIKNVKKVRTVIVRPHYSCCVQKTAPKTRNIRKIKAFKKKAKIGL